MRLPQSSSKILAEYVWIGGSGADLRAKTRTLDRSVERIEDLPLRSFDGSSTNQATGSDSEVLLKPVKFIPDPLRQWPHVMVMCETLDPEFNPHP